jgi:hypothetical protein
MKEGSPLYIALVLIASSIIAIPVIVFIFGGFLASLLGHGPG